MRGKGTDIKRDKDTETDRDGKRGQTQTKTQTEKRISQPKHANGDTNLKGDKAREKKKPK